MRVTSRKIGKNEWIVKFVGKNFAAETRIYKFEGECHNDHNLTTTKTKKEMENYFIRYYKDLLM